MRSTETSSAGAGQQAADAGRSAESCAPPRQARRGRDSGPRMPAVVQNHALHRASSAGAGQQAADAGGSAESCAPPRQARRGRDSGGGCRRSAESCAPPRQARRGRDSRPRMPPVVQNHALHRDKLGGGGTAAADAAGSAESCAPPRQARRGAAGARGAVVQNQRSTEQARWGPELLGARGP
jgi:hypothetical protein